MRSVLALGLLITLCASANATTVHHSKLRHRIVHPSQGILGSDISGYAYAPPRSPVYYDDAPSYGYYGSPSDHNSSQWGGQPD